MFSSITHLPEDVVAFSIGYYLAPRDILTVAMTNQYYHHLFQSSATSCIVWKKWCHQKLSTLSYDSASKRQFNSTVARAQYWVLRYKRCALKEVIFCVKSITGREFNVVMKLTDNKWRLKRTVKRLQCQTENLYLSDFDLVDPDTKELLGVVGESSIGPSALQDISTFLQLYPRSIVFGQQQQQQQQQGELSRATWGQSLSDCVDGAVLVQTLVGESIEDLIFPSPSVSADTAMLTWLNDSQEPITKRKNVALQLAMSETYVLLYKQCLMEEDRARPSFHRLLNFDTIVNKLLVQELGGNRAWKLCSQWHGSSSPIYDLRHKSLYYKTYIMLHWILSFLRATRRWSFWRDAIVRGCFTWGAASVTLRIIYDFPYVIRNSFNTVLRRSRRRTTTSTIGNRILMYTQFGPQSLTFDLLRVLVRVVIHMVMVARRMVAVGTITEIGREVVTMSTRNEGESADTLVACGVGALGAVSLIFGRLTADNSNNRANSFGQWVGEFLLSSGIWLVARKLKIPEEIFTRVPTLTYLVPVGLTGVVLRL
jgi:hypothetical protein